MSPKVTGAIVSGIGGALLGSITGYLIDKGRGAGYGALIGGGAMAVVGATATSSSTGTPTGTAGFPVRFGVGSLPRQQARKFGGAINDQLCPA